MAMNLVLQYAPFFALFCAFALFCTCVYALIEIMLLLKKRRLKWHCGIYEISRQERKLSTKFDQNKKILYIPRRFVGVWRDERLIRCDMNYHAENVRLLNMLSERYNLILYIPFIDHDGVRVRDIGPSLDYIESYNFPIAYITQELPSSEVMQPLEFYFENKKYMFTVYQGGEEP